MKSTSWKIFTFFILFLLPAIACNESIPLLETSETPTSIPLIPTQAAITQVVVQSPLTTVITDEDAVLIDLYQRINPSVVNILVYVDQGNLLAEAGQGSGFVYDQFGHIITNAHVVHNAEAVEVSFADGSILKSQVVGEDLHSDLAVIKVDNLPPGVAALPLGNIEEVAVGQTVVAIGNPFGLGGTLTRGIVSALGRTIPALTSFSIPQAIQTDAPINPGNSGGPLLNLKGEVIGVNAQIETSGDSRSNSGVGFAIPVSILKIVIPDLIAKGKHEWAWMGVVGGSVNPLLLAAMNLPVSKGAYISQVVDGGPADKAGLRGSTRQLVIDNRPTEIGGDVIIAVDGQPVNSFEDMLIYIALHTSPGQEIIVTIIRNGQQQDISIVLEPRPEQIEEFLFP